MKKVLGFAVAAIALFAACQKTEVVYQNDGPQEISLFAVNKVATKAPVSGVDYPTDYDMSVAAYLASGGTNVGNYFDNTTFGSVEQVTNPQTYLWAGKRYWPLTYSKINFLAISTPKTDYTGVGEVTTNFNSTTPASAVSVTLKGNETTTDKFNQFDLMYAAGLGDHSATTPYPNVDLKFQHALSWINFTVATNNVENVTVTVNSIRLNGAHYGGTLSLTNSKYNATETYSTSDAITISYDNWTSHSEAKDDIYVPNGEGNERASGVTCEVATTNRAAFGNGLLVVPKKYTDKYPSFTINYTITYGSTSTTYEYTHDFATSNIFEWEPDKKYTYNITMNLHEIKVAPTVDSWTTSSVADINL